MQGCPTVWAYPPALAVCIASWLRDEEAGGSRSAPQTLDHAECVPSSDCGPAFSQLGKPSSGVCKTVGLAHVGSKRAPAGTVRNSPAGAPRFLGGGGQLLIRIAGCLRASCPKTGRPEGCKAIHGVIGYIDGRAAVVDQVMIAEQATDVAAQVRGSAVLSSGSEAR